MRAFFPVSVSVSVSVSVHLSRADHHTLHLDRAEDLILTPVKEKELFRFYQNRFPQDLFFSRLLSLHDIDNCFVTQPENSETPLKRTFLFANVDDLFSE